MKVYTLDNDEVRWSPGSRKEKKYKPSKLQQKAIDVIKEILGGTPILQEVTIPITLRKKLRLDIYLPRHNIAFEIQGAQHGKRIPHFQTRQQHNKQVANDECKKEWCNLNGISLLYFNHDETIEQWMIKLTKALGLG